MHGVTPGLTSVSRASTTTPGATPEWPRARLDGLHRQDQAHGVRREVRAGAHAMGEHQVALQLRQRLSCGYTAVWASLPKPVLMP